MSQKIKNIFKDLKNVEPSAELEGKILKAIALEKGLEIRKKLMYARAGLAVSFGALIYILAFFGKSFLESDFWNIAKLIFSDSGVVASHISEYSVSLLETLPAVEIFAVLLPVFAVMMFLSYYFKFTNNKFNHITQ